jgi:sugar/nucleoside kinase (ribokinase family)
MNDHDVYSYGVISASKLYLLKDHFPARNGYAEIARKYRNVGGEAANTSIVLSRLGFDVKLDGNWLNPDDDAAFLRDVFSKNDIDISRISFRRCLGPKEMLVVDADSRTIFGTYAQLLEEGSWNFPQRNDIKLARAICLDPFFAEASVQAARYAAELAKPIVTVDCRFDDPLCKAADITIISEEYIGHTYPYESIASVTNDYRGNSGGAVILTFGHKQIVFGSGDEEFRRFAPYEISPVDTTGAGDSFRAGVICGLLKEWPLERTIQFASALAALVCQSYPGVLNSPSYAEVISFLNDHENDDYWARQH